MSWRIHSLIVAGLCCLPPKAFAADGHWVTTWGCGPQLTEPANRPPVPLANRTLRQFVHVTLGGNRLRVRFSNAFGTNLVTINSARVALASGAGSAGGGNINPATDQPLTFRGAPSFNLPAGEAVYSDPLDFRLPPLTNLAISVYFGDISATTITGHPGSRTTSFIHGGDAAAAAAMPAVNSTRHWYVITGVETWAGLSSEAVVVLGDSITDGRGSTTDGNNRWPDDLAQRLQANAPTAGVAVVNMGIGGGGIYHGLGPAAVNRFDRDVLGQNGVYWLILFEGVNDIGGDSTGAIAPKLIAAYTRFINQSHSRNIRAYGATITPFGGNGYFSLGHEASRQAVNAWIRTNNLCDAVIDFDAAVRNPVTLTNLLSAYDSGDGLHLNPLGYQTMANSINLNLFAP